VLLLQVTLEVMMHKMRFPEGFVVVVLTAPR
jgi:hypothetical protein